LTGAGSIALTSDAIVDTSVTARAGLEPDSTKARILAAAEQVFAARGFDGASTREIAGRAGVNISSLHYHWDSKETLYVAVFQAIVGRIEAHLRTSIPSLRRAARDRQDVVRRIMESLYDFLDADPTIPTLLVRRVVDGGEHDLGIERDVFVPAWDAFSGWLGDTGVELSEPRARLFMLSIHSMLLVYLLDSPMYRLALGESVRTPTMRAEVRAHVVDVVNALMDRMVP
jgi:AcrR family transcriptional regulator